jgi:hypothetical protein
MAIDELHGLVSSSEPVYLAAHGATQAVECPSSELTQRSLYFSIHTISAFDKLAFPFQIAPAGIL